MIRLVVYAVIFCAGMWVGAEYERVTGIDACLDAGGAADPRGFCIGAGSNG